MHLYVVDFRRDTRVTASSDLRAHCRIRGQIQGWEFLRLCTIHWTDREVRVWWVPRVGVRAGDRSRSDQRRDTHRYKDTGLRLEPTSIFFFFGQAGQWALSRITIGAASAYSRSMQLCTIELTSASFSSAVQPDGISSKPCKYKPDRSVPCKSCRRTV